MNKPSVPTVLLMSHIAVRAKDDPNSEDGGCQGAMRVFGGAGRGYAFDPVDACLHRKNCLFGPL